MLTLNMPGVSYLVMSWPLVTNSFQIWRLFTCFIVFAPLGMQWIMSVYLICQYFRELESNEYAGIRGAAELLFVALYGMIVIHCLSYAGVHVFPSVALLSMFVYIWSRKNPHQPLIVYGFTFQRWHMPVVIIGMGVLLNRSPPFDPVTGVAVGHLWLFLTETVPRIYGKTLITVPESFYQFVDRALTGQLAASVGVAEPAAGAPAARPNWMRGQGHRLDQ